MIPFVNEASESQKLKVITGITIISLVIFALAYRHIDAFWAMVGNSLNEWAGSRTPGFLMKALGNPLGFGAIWGLVYYIYAQFLWKVWPFSRNHSIPMLEGKWTGTITSDISDNKFPIAVTISQCINGIELKFDSPGNFSSSVTMASFFHNENGLKLMRYTYTCHKNARRDHDGTTVLELHNGLMKGYYYTDKPATEEPADGALQPKRPTYAGFGTIQMKLEQHGA